MTDNTLQKEQNKTTDLEAIKVSLNAILSQVEKHTLEVSLLCGELIKQEDFSREEAEYMQNMFAALEGINEMLHDAQRF